MNLPRIAAQHISHVVEEAVTRAMGIDHRTVWAHGEDALRLDGVPLPVFVFVSWRPETVVEAMRVLCEAGLLCDRDLGTLAGPMVASAPPLPARGPGPVYDPRAILRTSLLQVCEMGNQRPVARRPDGTPVSAVDMIDLLDRDDPAATEFLADLVGATLRACQVRAAHSPVQDAATTGVK